MKKKRKSKFNNVYTMCDGIKFHSRLESRFYKVIKKFVALSNIVIDYRLQVPFIISEEDKRRKYIADFVIATRKNFYVIECKGYQTAVSQLKMQIFKLKYPEYKLFIGSDLNSLNVFLKNIN